MAYTPDYKILTEAFAGVQLPDFLHCDWEDIYEFFDAKGVKGAILSTDPVHVEIAILAGATDFACELATNFACYEGNAPVVKLLLESGRVDVTTLAYDFVSGARKSGDATTIRYVNEAMTYRSAVTEKLKMFGAERPDSVLGCAYPIPYAAIRRYSIDCTEVPTTWSLVDTLPSGGMASETTQASLDTFKSPEDRTNTVRTYYEDKTEAVHAVQDVLTAAYGSEKERCKALYEARCKARLDDVMTHPRTSVDAQTTAFVRLVIPYTVLGGNGIEEFLYADLYQSGGTAAVYRVFGYDERLRRAIHTNPQPFIDAAVLGGHWAIADELIAARD